MTIHYRRRVTVVPGLVYLNLSRSGASWTFRLWRWSYNTRARRHRIDLPGRASWSSSRRP